jgi:hypothetical protein
MLKIINLIAMDSVFHMLAKRKRIQGVGVWTCWTPGWCSTVSNVKAKMMLVAILLDKDFGCMYVLSISGETDGFDMLR